MSEELDRLRRSMGPSAQEKVALAGGLEAAAQVAAQLGRWDAATTWSAEVGELCRLLADEDWTQHAETLALTLVNYSVMLGLSVHDPKAAQRRRTEITRTTIDELR
ncbi:hypothetical protein [Alloactinosynnema sp. L-07]|uniref:hypothetical protein n=1 Tax=Alloactinosynnema sp. L-07 TaxID=1653480 RepID=UPI00065F001F|nr:hypothetical protein [Alloactinosynnema sp. L-07]CRK56823.1 hypothetical protein [Alloactinosynnema sp. L-07]